MSPQDTYRRLRRLFPAEWRERNERELVGTLLDAADDGRGPSSLGVAVDLVRCATVLRWRALATRVGRAGAGAAARRAALAVALVAAFPAVWLVGSRAGGVSVEFLLTSLVVAVVPGTGVLYTVSSAMAGGWRRGVLAASGCTLGIVPHVLAAMLGLSGVMQAGAVAFEAVRWLGVAYLVFMGVSMIRDGGALRLDGERGRLPDPAGLVVRRGIVVNLLNPKLTAFFFAFLPQFLDSPPGLLDPRLVGLGAVFMLTTLVVFATYAGASALVRDRVLGAPVVLRWLQRSLGALVIGFAARLATTDR